MRSLYFMLLFCRFLICVYNQGDFPPNTFTTEVIPEEHVESSGLQAIKMKFNCSFNPVDGLLYDVAWYIEDVHVRTFSQLSSDELQNAMLLEEDWADTFSLGMMIKCATRARYSGNSNPGPFFESSTFFAGIEILDKEIAVLEGEMVNVRFRSTVPIGCILGQRLRHVCILEMALITPNYQERNCNNGVTGGTINFLDQPCGVTMYSSTWGDVATLRIHGHADGLNNLQPRIVYVYLRTLFVGIHDVWSNMRLPCIRVSVLDSDAFRTGSRYCDSMNNGPHIQTFDGRGFTGLWYGAEYILYAPKGYPIAVHAKYQTCNRGLAKCNCGIAIRSYTSVFVANFCGQVDYRYGIGIVNRSIENTVSDDNHMVVELSGNQYMITLPTGSIVTFSYGNVYNVMGLGNIRIQASVLDYEASGGICGYISHSPIDDFMPRDSDHYINDARRFSDSWRVSNADSMFRRDYIPPTPEVNLRRYCTCTEERTGSIFPNSVTCNAGIQLCQPGVPTNTDVYYRECPEADNNDRSHFTTSPPTADTTARDFPPNNFTTEVIPEEHVDESSRYQTIKMKFNCSFNPVDGLLYDVAWYIEDVHVRTFSQLSSDELQNASLMEEDWTDTFSLGMMIKCATRVRYSENATASPFFKSLAFFAGIEILEKEVAVLEGEVVNLHFRSTIPIGCSLGQSNRRHCKLEIFLHTPHYQDGNCNNGITGGAINFVDERCGVTIHSSTWRDVATAEVHGYADSLYNQQPRIVYVYLKSLSVEIHDMWSNMTLPSIKVSVLDSDAVKTRRKYCYSMNDPHMTTFDGKHWELQWYEAEYILYAPKAYPIAVHAKYQTCNRGRAKCNCGIAIRSYTSVFIVNFCGQVDYRYGIGTVNRYIEKRGCDDNHMVVEPRGNKYTITLPTGSIVTFSYGNVYRVMGLHTITIQASGFDYEASAGLCGYISHSTIDDFMPRGSDAFTHDTKRFSDSWKVSTEDSMFRRDYTPPTPEETPRRYCTCTEDSVGNTLLNNVTCNIGIQLCQPGVPTNTDVYYTECSGGITGRGLHESDNVIEPIEASLFGPEVMPAVAETWTPEQSQAFCEEQIGRSVLASLCRDEVGIDPEPFVQACVLDIQYTNDTAYTTTTLEAFKGMCAGEAVRNISLSESESPAGNTNSSTLLEYILERSCLNDCSGHGVCVEGTCNCTGNYIDVDCSQNREVPPEIFGIPNFGRCDTTMRSCEMTSVIGSNIASSEIYCRIRMYKVDAAGKSDVPGMQITQGFRRSYGEAACIFPENTRKKRQTSEEVMATGFYVSVGYDGVHFSDEFTIIIYDAQCYNCSSDSVCEIKDGCPYFTTSAPTADFPTNSETIILIASGVGLVVLAIIVVVAIFLKRHYSQSSNKRWNSVGPNTASSPSLSSDVAKVGSPLFVKNPFPPVTHH